MQKSNERKPENEKQVDWNDPNCMSNGLKSKERERKLFQVIAEHSIDGS